MREVRDGGGGDLPWFGLFAFVPCQNGEVCCFCFMAERVDFIGYYIKERKETGSLAEGLGRGRGGGR